MFAEVSAESVCSNLMQGTTIADAAIDSSDAESFQISWLR